MSQWQFFLRQAPLYFSHASGYWADNVMKFLEAIWFSWESPKHQLKHFTHFKRVLIAISMIWSLPWDHFSSWLFWWLEKLGDVRNSYFPTQQVLDFFFFLYFFWILFVNGTVISLVHLSFAAEKQQIDIFNILMEISLARSTSSFGRFSIFSQSMVTVLLFFSLVNYMSCCLFQSFLTIFLIVSSLYLPPRPRANATSCVLYNPPNEYIL